jgi:rhodanese-related sulfurtransferase
MTIEQIDPQEAHRRMGQGHVYLDVRSTPEFARAHATGAYNVPLLEPDPATGGMAPNVEFLTVCLASFPKDTMLVVGCAAGGRSQRACEVLQANGYTVVANIRGGFSGAHDPDGRVVAKGWAELGLPVSTQAADGATYAALVQKARA